MERGRRTTQDRVITGRWSTARPGSAGQFGNGILLDGVNDYVSVANPSTLNFGTSDFTIALWLKRQAIGTENNIFSKTANANWTSGGKEWFISGSRTNWALGVSTRERSSRLAQSQTTASGTTLRLRFIDNSNTVTFYIDGVASGGGTLNLPADVASHVIKIGTNPGGTFFNGQLDEFRVFNRALSASEIQNIKNNAILP